MNGEKIHPYWVHSTGFEDIDRYVIWVILSHQPPDERNFDSFQFAPSSLF